MAQQPTNQVRKRLLEGRAIPALPLALDRRAKWSERRQRAVLRYYLDAGVGGVAVGVHSTQFEIRDAKYGLFEPVLKLAAETISRYANPKIDVLRIAGVCGPTKQALAEASLARQLGYDAALLSLAAWKSLGEPAILKHCARIAAELPIIGFYLQPSVGGMVFSYDFWRRFAEIENVVAIKIAPFNRYRTLDVIRAVLAAGRDDVALYTGNDDNIIADLLTKFSFKGKNRFIDGGLLGQWGVWTAKAVALLEELKIARGKGRLDAAWMRKNADLTDANAAVFDAANGFAGCIPGIHEILRRQGIFESAACLNPHETLSAGQSAELDRVTRAYPWLVDDAFVQENVARWLS